METKHVAFNLEKTYLKDLSFESPFAGHAAPLGNSSRFDADFQSNVTSIGENRYEICLTLTGKGINSETENVVYLIELAQAGVFVKEGEIEEDLLRKISLTDCLQILFPYLREAVDSILVKSGFPPLVINNIDFKSSYMEALEVQDKGET